MALTLRQQLDLRKAVAEETAPHWTKNQVSLVFDAIEDWWTSPAVRSALSSAMDATGLVLTNQEKRIAMKHWLKSRFGRE